MPKRRLRQVVGAEREELGASAAISSARSAARGSSIIVPTMIVRASRRAPARRPAAIATMRACTMSSSSCHGDQRDHDLGHAPATPVALAALDRRLEDGARLHLVDLGIGDRQPAAADARASGWTRAARRRGRAASRRRRRAPSATSAISSSLCGRNSCSGGSSSRMVTGRPCHDLEQLDEVAALHRQDLGQRRAAARPRRRRRIISRTATMRSGVEEHVLGAAQADALGAELARRPRVGGRVGVGADLQPARLVGPAPSAWRSRRTAPARRIGTAPRITSPVRAVDGDDVALLERDVPPARDRRWRCSRSRSAPAPETQGLPMPRATTAAWLVMPPRAVRMPSRRMHAVDVLRAGLDADQDHLRALRLRASRPRRRSNTISPVAAPGEAGRPGRDDCRARRLGIERRMQQLVERAGLDAADRLLAADQALATMSTAIFSAALAVRLPVRVCSIQSLPFCDGELDVLHVAVMLLEPLADRVELARRPPASASSSEGCVRPAPLARRFGQAAACGCPATTSSPWALTRNSP